MKDIIKRCNIKYSIFTDEDLPNILWPSIAFQPITKEEGDIFFKDFRLA